jgi:signal transduction histidine kinase/type II secretory pathway pseudopilin PulG
MRGTRSPRPAEGGIDALLARTRRQVAGFTLVAIVSVIAVVGVGSALAGSRAIDTGLDNALRERAADILHEIHEKLPPLPSPEPSGDPSESLNPDESSAPGVTPSPSTSPGTSPGATPGSSPRESAEPEPTLPPGNEEEEEEEGEEEEEEEGEAEEDESEGSAGARVGADTKAQFTASAFVFGQAATVRGAAPQITRADEPIDPTAGGIPPEVLVEEFDEDGPWAILSPNGTVLATSEAATSEFPLTAAAAEAAGVADVRTVQIGTVEYRLMTLPVRHPDAGVDGPLLGYVQVAGRLDISDAQQASLLTTLLIFGGLGLAAALLVSVLVTRRVLAPIAAAATRERGMVAKASHELRTPASVILSSAEILEREGLVKPAGRDLLRGIAEESQRLGRLSADLLTLVKDRAGDAGQQLALAPGDVAEVARTAAERAKIMTAGSERTVETEIADRTLSAAIDADRLLQLLLNLVENAIRHSPPGGIITIGAAAHDGRAELWVDDEGLGIPEDERELVFDPFYRSPRDRSSRDGGSGLGLAIARSIVVAHGGSLTAESSASGGARLVARIPLIRAE